jgi:hypothetical protein
VSVAQSRGAPNNVPAPVAHPPLQELPHRGALLQAWGLSLCILEVVTFASARGGGGGGGWRCRPLSRGATARAMEAVAQAVVEGARLDLDHHRALPHIRRPPPPTPLSRSVGQTGGRSSPAARSRTRGAGACGRQVAAPPLRRPPAPPPRQPPSTVGCCGGEIPHLATSSTGFPTTSVPLSAAL